MLTHESYVNAICIIVFTLFVVVFTFMIGSIVRMNLRLISLGDMDDKIEREVSRKLRASYSTASKIMKVVSFVVSIAILCLFVGAFLLSVYSAKNENSKVGDIPTLKVVMSNSMSVKNEKNTYLEENGLDNQFSMYDLVLIREMPPVEELELYDIVVYEIDGQFVIHRIIEIDPPNERHSQYHFRLKGDAATYEDKFPVKYEQMVGIYEDESIPFLGSFFLFMRSPGGYLCLILTLFAVVIAPILEWILEKAKEDRWYGF